MVEDEGWYVEVSEGVKRKTPPEMIKVTELQHWQAQRQESAEGLFATVFTYPTDDPYVDGVLGDFFMDFDDAENPDRARKEALAVVKKLVKDYDIPEDTINIAFSGSKGISLQVSHEIFGAECSADLPLIWKSIAKELGKKLKLQTVDTGIYERRRLWRLLNSKHPKSGLHKIPLTLSELKLSIQEIRQKAVSPRRGFQPLKIAPVLKAQELYQSHQRKIEEWKQNRKKAFEKAELVSVGKEEPPCVRKLFQQGAEEDVRNISLFQLAVYWSQKGLSEEEIVKLAYDFAKRCKQDVSPFPEGEEVEKTVHSAFEGVQEGKYSVGCTSETLAAFCDRENCPFFDTQKRRWVEVGDPITYDEWRKVIEENFPDLAIYVEACASTVAVLLVKYAQPLSLVLQGSPSTGKTTTLSFFYDFIHSHKTDKFTPASFVSHAPDKEEKELARIDLLPRIKDKVLITSELNTIFGLPVEKLKEILPIIIRIMDGRGYSSESGLHGPRGYSGDYVFTWIGATIPFSHKVWQVMANLGSRMYFMKVEGQPKTDEEYIQEMIDEAYRLKVERCNKATLRFLKHVWQVGQVEWDRKKDSKEALLHIVQLAKLLARLRGEVNVSVKEYLVGVEPETYFSDPKIESPQRAIQALYNLAQGHALIKDRRQVTMDDLPLLIEVALSSAPIDRVNAFKYLLMKQGKATTADLMNDLKISQRTAIRSMKTLAVLGIVNLEKTSLQTEEGMRFGYIMRLQKDFEWFTSDEFKRLWGKELKPEIKGFELFEPREVSETLQSFTERMGKTKRKSGRSVSHS